MRTIHTEAQHMLLVHGVPTDRGRERPLQPSPMQSRVPRANRAGYEVIGMFAYKWRSICWGSYRRTART